MYYFGFDIGASSVKAVLIKNEEIIKSALRSLPPTWPELVALLEEMFKELSDGVTAVDGIGFGFAGMLDKERTEMLVSPNIKYLNGQPLKNLLSEKFKPYAIKIEHDAHCFLLAEKKAGLAKNLSDVFYLTLGSGIGGAWMVDGKIAIGSHGAAGEIAHSIIDISEQTELESLASNEFILSLLGEGFLEAGKSAVSGNIEAQEVFRRLGKNLGIGVANIINIFDPQAVIISGGISEAKDFILPGIKEGIENFVSSPAAKETKILFSNLGRFGGALGAALMSGQ